MNERIKEIKEIIRKYENKIPLSDDETSKQYTGNPYYTIGWIKSVVERK